MARMCHVLSWNKRERVSRTPQWFIAPRCIGNGIDESLRRLAELPQEIFSSFSEGGEVDKISGGRARANGVVF